MNHLINRLRFEVSCPDENQAFELRHNFAQTLQVQIMEVVDQVCSKHVNEDEWIQLDKLDIDLGKFTPHSFSTGFSKVFLYKFERELVEKLSGLSVQKRKDSRRLSLLELFQYFMEKGILPWWSNEQELDWNEISSDVFTHQTEALKLFFHASKTKEVVWKRAAFQLTGDLKETLISFFPELIKIKDQFETWLPMLQQKCMELFDFQIEMPRFAMHDILLKNAVSLFRQPELLLIQTRLFEQAVSELIIDHSNAEDAISFFKENVFPKIIEKGEENSKVEAMPIDIDDSRDEHEDASEEKLIVKHAGLVLLAPFLKAFFTKLELLEGEDWKNQSSVYKAIHLLSFLSTGLQQVPEYSLTLEKSICGFSITEPIPIAIELNEVETQECELLLSSIIEHWKVLKNTSINGLRESFLKRDGLLTKLEKGWLLQVERKTLDVLLDSIPWGYSTLHLPWNEQVIFVEW